MCVFACARLLKIRKNVRTRYFYVHIVSCTIRSTLKTRFHLQRSALVRSVTTTNTSTAVSYEWIFFSAFFLEIPNGTRNLLVLRRCVCFFFYVCTRRKFAYSSFARLAETQMHPPPHRCMWRNAPKKQSSIYGPRATSASHMNYV